MNSNDSCHSLEMLDTTISFVGRMLTFLLMMEQAFPDEVLDLDRSVRTLDLTHNKIGGYLALFFLMTSCCGHNYP